MARAKARTTAAIEALVAVVNHRHGTTDWMPIDLRIYDNFQEAVARYKHFDLLMVNALFDGMNLVAKEYVACRQAARAIPDELLEAAGADPVAGRAEVAAAEGT